MLHTLNVGDKVKVWPRPGLKIPLSPPSVVMSADGINARIVEARALSPDGEEVAWSLWLHEHAKGGALFFSDPSEMTHATHVHPGEAAKTEKKED